MPPRLPPPLPPRHQRPAECPKCFCPLDGLPDYGQCPDCGHNYGVASINHFIIRLQKCPQCDYSLQGLGASGRCPECGFVYDDETFVLEGIARGMTTMPLHRKLLWVFTAGVGAFMPSILSIVLQTRVRAEELLIVGSVVGSVWVGVLIYLLTTGKKEKRGMEPFLFAAGGFGSCSDLDPAGSGKIKLTLWGDVDGVRLDRVGKTWRRLRIGKLSPRSGRFTRGVFDAGVRCDNAQAALVERVLDERIAAAKGNAAGA